MLTAFCHLIIESAAVKIALSHHKKCVTELENSYRGVTVGEKTATDRLHKQLVPINVQHTSSF